MKRVIESCKLQSFRKTHRTMYTKTKEKDAQKVAQQNRELDHKSYDVRRTHLDVRAGVHQPLMSERSPS